ncbi:MAG: DUF6514 family protein [Defluviitaleaceae bacterium]|nr:DUF6514 family protein [Defluviitaleaceae bacterium]MCL2835552.1 DUF6514 family protein [Defluviitaleaceae bacterium]
MLSYAASLVYDKQFTDFIVRYYLTTKTPEKDTASEPEHVPYYGVLLEKVCERNTVPESADVLLSESNEAALHVLQVLYNMEVTPMSLYEVIDQIVERETM